MPASDRSEISRITRTTARPIEPPAGPVASTRRGISGQVAGDAHEGSLTSTDRGPNGQARVPSTRADSQVSRLQAPRDSGSPSGPEGGRDRSGTSRSRSTAPARALSSQSEQPLADVTTQRTLSSPAAAIDAGRERLRRVVARQPLHPFAAPLAERRTDPVTRARRPRPPSVGAAWSTMTCARPSADCSTAPSSGAAAPPAPPNAAPAVNASASWLRAATTKAARCSSSGPRSSSIVNDGALRRRSSKRFWSSPSARLMLRPSRAVTGARDSSRRLMSSSSGPGAGSSGAASAPPRRRRGLGRHHRGRRGATPRERPARPRGPGPGPDAGEELVHRGSGRGATGVVLARPSPGFPAALRRRHRGLPRRVLRRILVVGSPVGALQPELVADGGRGRPGLLVGALQMGQDPVHLVAHAEHRRRHLVTSGTELLNLDPEGAAPGRQVGQHAVDAPLGPARAGPALRPWRGR